jgi:prolipoprotein diacylglyceryl transferase
MFGWDMDPVALEVGPLAIRWYGILFALAFVAGYHMMVVMSRAEGRDPAPLERLLTFAVVGTVVGARLGHCLFYEPEWYLAHPWEILKIWEGGLASHGGAVGLVAGVWAARLRDPGVDVGWVLRRLPLPAAVGGACIRLGNFWNSEILGKPATVPWAVVFARVDGVARHPVQLYEAATYLGIGMLLAVLYRRPWWRERLLGLFLLLVFGLRMVWETVKMPQAALDATGMWTTGQLLSIPFVLVGLGLVLWPQGGLKRRQG